MKKKYPSTVYLSIAGFTIQIIFKRSFIYSDAKNELQKNILDKYKCFIINKPDTAPVGYIFIQAAKKIEVIVRKKDNVHYAGFYFQPSASVIITYYHINLAQFYILIRNFLLQLLTRFHGFILHASANLSLQGAEIFVGRERAGKSTIMKLLHSNISAIADDSIIIRSNKNQFQCYQSPFIEKEPWIRKNIYKYSINRIFILRKSSYCKIEKIYDPEIISKYLFSQILTDKNFLRLQIRSIFQFILSFHNFYYLYFNREKKQLTKLLK